MPVPKQLDDVAFLHLAVAHGADGYLSDAELGAVIERLQRCYPQLSMNVLQTVVARALSLEVAGEDLAGAVEDAARRLERVLTLDEQEQVLADLVQVARADGVVLHRERTLLHRLARSWEMDPPPLPPTALDVGETTSDRWGVLHDLAFLYLVLAHGTDHELSVTELQVIIAKLHEWHPALTREQVQAVLDRVVERYAAGPDVHALAVSVHALHDALPEEQRMAALNDLVQIANADGVFLDDEEDLINNLMETWELTSYVGYGDRGTKDAEGRDSG